ncbi:MAG: DTW domain-containing protein [Deltaproteobacteria bacterium]|nr:DTW domain-containing protein [Deltaproteobacteria bacterium]MBK8235306.1 DTW domain-containing protein [Deltaproteobacteria bacterium]MBK8716374.1 DTW domain-containing protein [Deltaproteobacteria bacterium]MBP7287904.1 DTW domain-containing protein [Nannocystaceae bacterium]
MDLVAPQPRAMCLRCRRPQVVCWCRFITPIPTRTRVVLVQHSRERDVAIGTARMASLSLPNSELHVGVDFTDDPALARALGDPTRPPILLYPGRDSIDVVQQPPTGPVTLVVVDGTWSQAKTLIRDNPQLASLPRYGFVPPKPSEYRIRREPQDEFVSTIEALVHVLGALEGAPARFEALMTPFRAMVDMQLEHIGRVHAGRRKLRRRPTRPSPRGPAILRERATDLLCIVGESNAWPHGHALRPRGSIGELVHWVAWRPATDERFEAVLAPRGPLAPNTPSYLELSQAAIEGGESVESFVARWRDFVREHDVVCSWGSHGMRLLRPTGGIWPDPHVDLRRVHGTLTQRRAGSLERDATALALPEIASPAHGRAGRRLALLAAVVRHYAERC